MHGIIIRPAIEVGWLDTLLREQRGDLRPMINGVVDGLDHHNDGRSLIGSSVKIEDLTQVPLLRDGDQFFQWRGRGCSSKMPYIAFFGSEQMILSRRDWRTDPGTPGPVERRETLANHTGGPATWQMDSSPRSDFRIALPEFRW